jgi:hypothetical protein
MAVWKNGPAGHFSRRENPNHSPDSALERVAQDEVGDVQSIIGDKYLVGRQRDAVGTRVHRPELTRNALIFEQLAPCLGNPDVPDDPDLGPHTCLRIVTPRLVQ